ncbi:hypothetical protein CGMCC3_g8320 [Colletotrichum fructicola]|uniref:Vegetative incompatibility protein HET-E-1 n=1 Tax=Colletotrichum fructicola (strain Nara gc5) TaxID=1213859 RepID=A0A7J6J3F6_COLFN|nr:uncharacterized protein CGMCC3_g8320 [Colletotrichum fructicola]KAE9575552.1 hypothetical protein CGMCC3_g8320 [Colletotrichum fructicola]KAF4484361.1 Vegetative incompatibility protein HET-E-1 [Colletotrichum fructicola Nara gc5]
MKLLRIDTGTLHKFPYPPQVPYAILSHTWSSPAENEWVQYNPSNAVIGRGISAFGGIITKFCHLARAQGYEHVWVDAVCIDKTSSADVSETINSLPRYFQGAGVCFVYLSDLPCGPTLPWKDTWAQCRFWNRAWTLQELLLPTKVQFYDVEWHLRGERAAGCLPALISDTTGIDEDILTQQRSLCQTSVARKMSWAARREGTRSEDVAYSLLGIFGVRMPIVYGEGEHRAFRRLQEEVLKTTNDMSLFAWTGTESEERRGIFADGPWEFLDFGKSTLARLPCVFDGFAALTSRGVLIEGQISEQSDALFLDLGVQQGDEDNFKRYGIVLQKRTDGTFERTECKLAEKLPTSGDSTTMRIIAWRGDLDVTEMSHGNMTDAPVDVKQSPDSVPALRHLLLISSQQPTTPERILPQSKDSLETETTPTGSNFNTSCLSNSEDREWVQVLPTSDVETDSDDCGQVDGYDSLQTSQYTDVDQEWDSAHDFFPFEGVSEDQRRLLSHTERAMSDADQWYRAWDILFEGLNLERPCSPFLQTGLGLSISNFRTFWHRHGRSILEESLADRHDGIPIQGIGMEKLSTEVLSDTLRTLAHISERQSPAYV